MASLLEKAYNPDVLTCLANLSNDEVFTPPELANDVLDMLPPEIWSDPTIKILDPCCKSGVFLREASKRFIKGLANEYPDLQERVDHIMHEQLFGIAITELTSLLSRRSLYCSKFPNGRFSVVEFDSSEGNVRQRTVQHAWVNGRCKFCGASNAEYNRDKTLETHAYEFIHTDDPERILNMKFDVIVGNPPYQLSTGGASAQAIPLYHKFIEQAKKLKPRYLSMIVPSRWFAGGMGLDAFRKTMLSDKHLVKIVDFTNAKDCFPGVSLGGGVCYFLWSRDSKGRCEFTNNKDGKAKTQLRDLDEFPIFVRYNDAISIIHKVISKRENSLTDFASSLSPYGIGSSERGASEPLVDSVRLYSSAGAGYLPLDEVPKGHELLDQYHVMISKVTAEHAGEPRKDGTFKVITKMRVLRPREVCTFSYFLIGNMKTENEANNLLGYMATKFSRFLLLQAVSSINLSKEKFQFIPVQDFSRPWTDEELYRKYELTNDEILFIESMIRPMDLGDSNE